MCLLVILVVIPSLDGEAGTRKFDGRDGNPKTHGESSLSEIRIFGDLGKSFRMPGTWQKKLWWERMAHGEVGRERFLILCALKDGEYKKLADIRDYVEFRMRETFPAGEPEDLLILMAGSMLSWADFLTEKKLKSGERWLERSHEGTPIGLDSQWRIAPSVLPLLYFLLAGCPEDDRCK